MFSGRKSGRSIALLTALALVVLLVAPLVVHANVPSTVIAFDFANQADNNGGGAVSSLSWSHTIGSGSNGILLVGVEFTIPQALFTDSVNYGTNHLNVLAGDASGFEEIDTFYMLNPPAGTDTVMVTFTGSSVADALGGSVSLFNVAQNRPSTASADDGHNVNPTIQLTVPANTGDLVIAAIMTNKGTVLTPGPGQMTPVGWTQKEVNGNFVGAASYAPASSPVTLSWTATLSRDSGSTWVMVGADLQPAAVIPEYPLGLPLLAVFMIVGYGLIRRRTKNPKNA